MALNPACPSPGPDPPLEQSSRRGRSMLAGIATQSGTATIEETERGKKIIIPCSCVNCLLKYCFLDPLSVVPSLTSTSLVTVIEGENNKEGEEKHKRGGVQLFSLAILV